MFGGVAGPLAEFVEQAGSEVLERPADSMLAGEGDSQPGGEQGGEDGRGHEGVLLGFGVGQLRHETIETTLSYYVGRNAERTAAILWHEHEKATESGRKPDVKRPRGKRGKTST